jgi:HAD superfamily hydrolase (TIGR01490 family)
MGKVAAIFDVDQTLVKGRTEQLFFRYLVRQGRLGMHQALIFLARLAVHPQERFQDKTYLEGLAVEEITRLARECYRDLISPRVSAAARACVREHLAQGHKVVLLTGSLSFLLSPLQEELGADWLIATELNRHNGHFTGKINGLHPRGENKFRLLLALSQAADLDLSQSYAYGDHIQDSFLLRHIGHPVVVNPSWRLKRLARKHRWPIRYF